MIFELIATGLLAYGVSTSSVNASNDYRSVDNNASYGQTLEVTPYNQLVNGIYNFRDSFDFSIFDIRDIGSNIIVFDNDENLLVPFTFDANNEPAYYLSSITYSVGDEVELTTNNVYVSFDYYDSQHNFDSVEVDIYSTDTLSSVSRLASVRTLMFYVINGVNLNQQDYKVFNMLFTRDDNTYMRSYSGYFTFTNGGVLLNSNNYVIFGTNTLSNQISFIFDFYSENNSYITSIQRLTYDVYGQKYQVSNFYINQRSSNLVYFDNVKMSISTYTALNGTLGVFTYIPTGESSSFEDLLFTIADTPIYFISRLLDFEMFGMNLYIALSGLLTLLVVIFIIRKIW